MAAAATPQTTAAASSTCTRFSHESGSAAIGRPAFRSAIRGSLSVLLTPFGWRKTLRMSFEAFSKTFANRVPADQQRAEYDRHIVPTPGRIFFQDAVGKATGVRFNNPSRAPLLITAASDDLTVDPAMVRANFRKYRGPAVTDFHEFPAHSHFLIAEPGWEEVADYTLDWAEARIPA